MQLRRNLLSLVGGDSRCVDTVSNTGDTTSDNKLSGSAAVRGHSCDLDNYTNDHDKSTKEDGLATTEFVTEKEDEDGAQKASDGVDGNDKTFVVGVVDLGKCFGEGGGGDDTAHNTLVITKEQEVSGCDHCDENLKHPTGLPPIGGHSGVVVLYAWHGEGWSKQQKAGVRYGGF